MTKPGTADGVYAIREATPERYEVTLIAAWEISEYRQSGFWVT